MGVSIVGAIRCHLEEFSGTAEIGGLRKGCLGGDLGAGIRRRD
jgi:hypothetical protein